MKIIFLFWFTICRSSEKPIDLHSPRLTCPDVIVTVTKLSAYSHVIFVFGFVNITLPVFVFIGWTADEVF